MAAAKVKVKKNKKYNTLEGEYQFDNPKIIKNVTAINRTDSLINFKSTPKKPIPKSNASLQTQTEPKESDKKSNQHKSNPSLNSSQPELKTEEKPKNNQILKIRKKAKKEDETPNTARSDEQKPEEQQRTRFSRENYILQKNLHEYIDLSKQVKRNISMIKDPSFSSTTPKKSQSLPPLTGKPQNVAQSRKNLSPLIINDSQNTVTLLEQNVGEIRERVKVLTRIEEFYQQLCTNKQNPNLSNVIEENESARMAAELGDHSGPDLVNVTVDEIDEAVKQMNAAHAAREDELMYEIMQASRRSLTVVLSELFTLWIKMNNVTPGLFKSPVLMVYKRDIKTTNSQSQSLSAGPISIILLAHRLFSKVLINRLSIELDADVAKNAPQSSYLQTATQLIEKAYQYNLPLYICFIHYESDLLPDETDHLVNSLADHNMHSKHAQLIKKVNLEIDRRNQLNAKWIAQNSNPALDQQSPDRSQQIRRKPNRREEESATSKLQSVALKTVWEKFNWIFRGFPVAVNRTMYHLNHFRNSEVVAAQFEELFDMTQELVVASIKIGLKIDFAKSKWLSNRDDPYRSMAIGKFGVIGKAINHVFFGQLICLNSLNNDEEVSRRIVAGWVVFNRLKGNI
jgi:hypothetical protein